MPCQEYLKLFVLLMNKLEIEEYIKHFIETIHFTHIIVCINFYILIF